MLLAARAKLMASVDRQMQARASRKLVDSGGAPLDFALVDTTMRIDLPEPLLKGQAFEFSLDWTYAINDQRKFGGRSGYEFFEDEKRYYLVTEICKGGELFDEILQRGKFSERDGAVRMRQVLSCIN